MASTRVELVAELIEVKKALKERNSNLDLIIRNARNGKYHDWDSNLDAPKVALVQALRACPRIDLNAIADRVVDGEFDEDPTEEQLKEIAEADPALYARMVGTRTEDLN